MNICMVGMDYQTADIAQREAFGLTQAQVRRVLHTIKQEAAVLGCAFIATCNRTELYLSVRENVDAGALLCQAVGVELPHVQKSLVRRFGNDAAAHLAAVASGLRSQIRGEDQILTQVKHALAIAHEEKTTDAILETLFRYAVTAGKQVKTEVRLTPMPTSSAHKAVEKLEDELGELHAKHCVVIGNGEIGRLVSMLLVQKGANVTITLRSYRHGITVVPQGCNTIGYENRAVAVSGADAVVSATTSPHYTITRQLLHEVPQMPRVIIDLAMPRDVEPAVSACTQVYNMDALASGQENAAETQQAQCIIARQLDKFYAWAEYRERILEEKPS